MTQKKIILSVLLLFPFWSNAQPIPSEVQSHEWTQPHPDFNILNSDRITEYKRVGKTVFRTIERTVTISMPKQPASKAIQHIIEFVADSEVFASVILDKASALSWNLTTGMGVHFSSGFTGLSADRRFFHICIPKYDYYEYLEVSGTDVKLIPETDESYASMKRGFMKLTEIGHINEPEESKIRQ